MKSSVLMAGIRTSISFAALLLLAGCQQNEALFGKWEGDRDWKKVNTTNEAAARALAAINLTLKSDGTFELTDGGMPFTGTWKRSDKNLELSVESFMNTSIAKQSKEVQEASQFLVEIDGSQLRYRSVSEDQSVTLKKL